MDIIEKINFNFKYTEKLRNKYVLVTGATGLIGSTLIKYLISVGANVIALARSEEKAKTLEYFDKVLWIFQELENSIEYAKDVDYIIHTASPTDSKYFIDNPVETINLPIIWLNNIMNFAKEKRTKSIIFTSSMEVYGLCLEDRFLSENEYFSIDATNVRNSYAEGKKILECLCSSYFSEYQLPIKIVRLCQTFGPGVSKNDNRVFAQFAKNIVTGHDIVLSTKGETKRSYCSLADCVVGILIALINGENGQAYNIASDKTYCSIYEMANRFTKGTNLKVIIDEKTDKKYLPTIKFGLCTDKIKSIGFKSIDDLDSIINEFLLFYKNLV